MALNGSAPSRLRPLAARLLLLVASLALTSGVLEVGLRLFAPQPLETPLDIYAEDGSFGHLLKRDLAARRVATSEWTMHLTTNADGFRGVGRPRAKPAGTRRILGIGDSFMFGYGVEEHESALARVAAGLEAATGGPVEPVNLGVPGHGPTQYLEILRAALPRYDPDLVVAMVFLNDLRASPERTPYLVERGYLVTERFSLRSLRSALLPVRGFLKTRSHAYVLVRDRLTPALQRVGLRPLERPDRYRRDLDLEARFAYTFDTIRAMARLCDRRGVPFLLCFVPEKQQVLEGYRRRVLASFDGDPGELDWDRPQAALSGLCDREGIECLDLTGPLRRAGAWQPIYFEVDLHWTPAGHAVAAGEVLRRLRELGWLAQASPGNQSM